MEESLILNKNICRICLEENIVLNWNEEITNFYGISFKGCYYKYTGLQANESDPFPQSLCEICSNGIKNAHLLFDKALESLKILQNAILTKRNKPTQHVSNIREKPKLQISSRSGDDCKTSGILEDEIPTDDNELIDIEDEIYFTQTDDDESLVLIKKSTEKFQKGITMNANDDANNNEHFIEINRCESPTKDLLEQIGIKNSDTKSSTKKQRKSGKKYLCSYCSLIVCDKTSLRDHESTHNENRERNYSCDQCGLKLYTQKSLKTHMEVHEENREKRFKCEFCDKAFFNRGACNVHRRIHLGQMVTCPICSKDFYRQIDLDKHLPKHSAAPLQKIIEQPQLKYRVQCQYCNKTIATHKWKEHKAIHLNQPVVRCKICEKDFYSRKRCAQHLKRLHRKTRDEYDEFIYCYIDCRKRISHLMIKQQNVVQSIPKNHQQD